MAYQMATTAYWDIWPKFGMQVDFENGSRIAMPWPPSWKGYDVITLSRMVRFWQNLTGRCRVICFPRMLDVHFDDAQTGPVHASKTANINEKNWQFTTSYKDDCSKIAELKQQISQKMIFTSKHSDISAMCCEVNIIFCDICCFSSAILLQSSL